MHKRLQQVSDALDRSERAGNNTQELRELRLAIRELLAMVAHAKG
jgi:hypothetical protein